MRRRDLLQSALAGALVTVGGIRWPWRARREPECEEKVDSCSLSFTNEKTFSERPDLSFVLEGPRPAWMSDEIAGIVFPPLPPELDGHWYARCDGKAEFRKNRP